MQKYNKKILAYKLKIRDLSETLAQVQKENDSLKLQNGQLKEQFEDENNFKSKITKLKSEYENKMKEIIDEVKEREEKPQTQGNSSRVNETYCTASDFTTGKKLQRCCSGDLNPCLTEAQQNCTGNNHTFVQYSPVKKPLGSATARYEKPTFARNSISNQIKVGKDQEISEKEDLSHMEKLSRYRKLKDRQGSAGLKTCRERFSEVGKIKCTHCKQRITAKEYHAHIKKCRVAQIVGIQEMPSEDVDLFASQSSGFLNNPMLFTSRRSSMGNEPESSKKEKGYKTARNY